jgi:MFS family permease
MDRIGKGIRGAPRDALIADVTPPELRGTAYGLRQAMDTVGAVLGPLAAIGLMLLLHDHIRSVLWIAVVPAILAVLALLFFVKEPETTAVEKKPLALSACRELHASYWAIVALGAILTLARFSEAFLVLRAQGLGLAIALVPVVLIVMNVVYTAIAYPAGVAADNGYKRALLVWGIGALIAADLLIGATSSLAMLFAGIVLWGAHMGLTQGLLSALIADASPAHLRGTAFGIFNLVSGGALLFASVLAGWLWSAYGPGATFYAGALFAAVALAGLVARMKST